MRVFGKLREDESRCNARLKAAPGRLSRPLAARRLRMRGVEQVQIQKTEARARNEREKVARRFGLLTEDSLDLLVELGQRDAKLAGVVGQALANHPGQLSKSAVFRQQKRASSARSWSIPRWAHWTWARGKTAGGPILPTPNTLWSHCLPKFPGSLRRSRQSKWNSI